MHVASLTPIQLTADTQTLYLTISLDSFPTGRTAIPSLTVKVILFPFDELMDISYLRSVFCGCSLTTTSLSQVSNVFEHYNTETFLDRGG